ncbi:MAG: hypothetical protein U5N85_13370 [Arcicella sp.]|nr:hypothetical protein [Arcicella sp.]
MPNADGSLPSTISFKAGAGSLARTFDATNNRISAVVVYNF